ncbi:MULTISPECIES: hypothetical protein [unclassified Microbacterium]|uniref:hypothetical protein n=1 Tax=unclassified Microbacterium TaxID=2609290 RepID=UPI00214AE2DB|nr:MULTISPECIES: hypothetical protein [unclassified Microbacterium]MCR2783578.1 hypothetical protein [Microbacterium sp. zg.B96]MDL5351651.1 hypothetical protein [Microbacterium sp. zg-YB36]WIM15562.1 hypothetical protein QNO11_13635 [Microbacterium sp. zg-B96]
MSVIIDEVRSADIRGGAAWFRVEPGFWVANTGGRYLGAVELLRSGGYSARNDTGAEVGVFASLAEARGAVASESS